MRIARHFGSPAESLMYRCEATGCTQSLQFTRTLAHLRALAAIRAAGWTILRRESMVDGRLDCAISYRCPGHADWTRPARRYPFYRPKAEGCCRSRPPDEME